MKARATSALRIFFMVDSLVLRAGSSARALPDMRGKGRASLEA